MFSLKAKTKLPPFVVRDNVVHGGVGVIICGDAAARMAEVHDNVNLSRHGMHLCSYCRQPGQGATCSQCGAPRN